MYYNIVSEVNKLCIQGCEELYHILGHEPKVIYLGIQVS